MRRRTLVVGFLWRWHRRMGLATALFALVLAVTGILLNHTPELGLDRQFVGWSWLQRAYGDRSGELPAYQLDGHWLSRAGNGKVYLDSVEVAPCRGDLVGAVIAGDQLAAACAEELLLLTRGGELVEAFSSSTGLPAPLTGIGLVASGVALQAGRVWWLADLDRLDFSAPAPGGSAVGQIAPAVLPVALRQALPGHESWLSWERLLLDLHSGRLFGRAGVWLVDFFGVLLCSLALSGVAMWWLHRRRGKGS